VTRGLARPSRFQGITPGDGQGGLGLNPRRFPTGAIVASRDVETARRRRAGLKPGGRGSSAPTASRSRTVPRFAADSSAAMPPGQEDRPGGSGAAAKEMTAGRHDRPKCRQQGAAGVGGASDRAVTRKAASTGQPSGCSWRRSTRGCARQYRIPEGGGEGVVREPTSAGGPAPAAAARYRAGGPRDHGRSISRPVKTPQEGRRAVEAGRRQRQHPAVAQKTATAPASSSACRLQSPRPSGSSPALLKPNRAQNPLPKARLFNPVVGSEPTTF